MLSEARVHHARLLSDAPPAPRVSDEHAIARHGAQDRLLPRGQWQGGDLDIGHRQLKAPAHGGRVAIGESKARARRSDVARGIHEVTGVAFDGQEQGVADLARAQLLGPEHPGRGPVPSGDPR